MPTKQERKRSPAVPEPPRRLTVGELRQTLGLSRRVFSRLTGFSERAIADWEGGKDLSEPTRQRMTELQRLQQGLARVMKQEFIADWLQTPNDAFGGLKPIEVVERGEIDRLWRMIYLLESGQPG
jgi:DNA-binding transcriptional regulator YiaG